MSHFTVLVVGDDVDGQLAPFHEFECTGSNDQYVVDEDVTEEVQSRINDGESVTDALDWYGLGEKVVDDESKVEKVGDECPHKFGYAIVKDGVLIQAINRTNPNRKWDWYQVGGRWSGFLKLKEGATGTLGERSWMNRRDGQVGVCDSALKGAIDFDGMRQEAGDDAGARWDKVHEVLNDRSFRTWEQVKTDNTVDGKCDYDKAREEYNAQPPVQDFRKGMQFGFFSSPDDYLMTREQYVANARATAINTFAVLKDGEWFEKGEMGWWGMSTDNMTDLEWAVKVGELIDSLSDDTQLTVIDCHI